ncbi:helix-turn-helix domain-containing protein [Methylobacterium sp. WSM2598]|uniref:helix-turn-helix domain-containing protein n=1 Tax=Methylobacterium sp. WSM2598 TaxID=398261 RepID=UPI00037F06FE|nr:helix-turn-helix domain-containing protein [Methylobacterium sp. WSM2598]
MQMTLSRKLRQNPKISYTTPEACAALGIGKTKLFELLARGQIKAVKVGARLLFTDESLRNFVNSLPEARAA